MRLDLAMYFYLSSIAEVESKEKKEADTDVTKITLAPKYILMFSEKYNFHFDSAQQGFKVKLDSLNDLKPLLIDDDLELEDVEHHDFVEGNDLEIFIDDLDAKNQAKIRKICNIAKDVPITKSNITDEIEAQIITAANDAYNDYVSSKLRSVVLSKLVKTKFFKEWNDGKVYKFDDEGHYILLVTPEFLYREWECDAFATDIFDSIITIFNHENDKIKFYQDDFDVSYDPVIFNQILEL